MENIRRKIMLRLIYLSVCLSCIGQTVVLENNCVVREFQLRGDSILSTVSYRMKGEKQNYVLSEAREFVFKANDQLLDGFSSWIINYQDTTDLTGGKGLVFKLQSRQMPGLNVKVTYFTYPSLPLVKKQLSFYNSGRRNIKLESLDVECFKIGWAETESWIMKNYGRYKHLGAYVGDWDDPLILIHDLDNDKGIAIGNEAPGVMKRSTALVDGKSVTAGLRYPEQEFGFRKWIAPGEEWKAPAVFTALYSNSQNPYEVMNTTVSDYTRKYMGTRLETLKRKPIFVYNTWFPFYTNINHDLLMELANAAAACGVEEFIVDDGWQVCHGDWEVNKTKFPKGETSV